MGKHTYTVTATSKDGLSGSASITYTVAPGPSARITTPASGSSYTEGQTVTSSFSCSDGGGGPGIGSCLDQTGKPSGSAIDTSRPGRHTFTVTATSNDGQSTAMSVTYTVRSPAPALSQLRLLPRRFLAAATGGAIIASSEVGTEIRYRNSLAARTTLLIYRPQIGVRRGRSCVKPPHGEPLARTGRCIRLVAVGRLLHQDRSGRNQVRFSGRVNDRPLSPCAYLLKITGRLAGQTSRTLTARFEILAPPPTCLDPDHDRDCDSPNQR